MVQQRAQDALLNIISPYIEDFLAMTDYELYIKYLQKSRQTAKMLQIIKEIVESR